MNLRKCFVKVRSPAVICLDLSNIFTECGAILERGKNPKKRQEKDSFINTAHIQYIT